MQSPCRERRRGSYATHSFQWSLRLARAPAFHDCTRRPGCRGWVARASACGYWCDANHHPWARPTGERASRESGRPACTDGTGVAHHVQRGNSCRIVTICHGVRLAVRRRPQSNPARSRRAYPPAALSQPRQAGRARRQARVPAQTNTHARGRTRRHAHPRRQVAVRCRAPHSVRAAYARRHMESPQHPNCENG